MTSELGAHIRKDDRRVLEGWAGQKPYLYVKALFTDPK